MAQRCEQLELPLFSPPSFSDLLSQKGITELVVVSNIRLKKSWRVKINRRSQNRTLNIPCIFEKAPEKIKTALIEWTLLATAQKRRGRSHFSLRKKELECMVWDYLAAQGRPIENVRNIAPGDLRFKGCRYDLQEVFDCLNSAYFGGKLSSYIRWNRSHWRSYQTHFLDSQGRRCNLISIARLYDRMDVPRFAIEAIVYHEMLHIAIPPYKRRFQNVIHGREFRRAEQSFPYFKQWRQWERECVKRKGL
jgi:hypothetical protein